MLNCPRRNAGIGIRNRTEWDSRSKAPDTPEEFKAGIVGSKCCSPIRLIANPDALGSSSNMMSFLRG